MASIHVDLLGCQTRFCDTGKYRTRVIECGKGKTLFLLHGGGGHAEAFSKNIRRLGQSMRAIAPDFIWHGLSSAPPVAKTNWLGQFTDQILEFMDSEKIEKASFEGESLGGWIAYDMAINHPDRTEKLILNTSWGHTLDPAHVKIHQADRTSLLQTSLNALRNPSRDSIRKRLEWLMPRGGTTDELVDLRYTMWSGEPTRSALISYYERLWTPETDALLKTEKDLARIKAPTLVLWTDSNPSQKIDTAKRLHAVIPNSEVYIMKNAAHWPQWEHAEEHDRVVAAFLAK
jgi:pimeloyl-ACP methyl ester carboxylesterase